MVVRNFEMSRRSMIVMSAGTAIVSTVGCQSLGMKQSTQASAFNSNFAAFPGLFEPIVGADYIAQLNFAHANGFRVWEDAEFAQHTAQDQEKYGQHINGLGMRMGVFVGIGDATQNTLTSGEGIASYLAKISQAVDVAQRGDGEFISLVSGTKTGNLHLNYQKAYAVDALRKASDIAAAKGKTLLIQPLARQSQAVFLKSIPEAYEICAAVDHPACAVLFDVNHQQAAGGNIIANIEQAKVHTGYYQIGGPSLDGSLGSVELSYGKIVEAMRQANPDAIIGLSHFSGQNTNAPTQRSKASAMKSIQTCMELDAPMSA
ncbi:TIM barrel protein [Hirschia litorea]|uniref:TIM barrel protein n=1 Tax=Hirschia litorea TaxID=1199156 RepID=A0ABW2INJ2_9PROT